MRNAGLGEAQAGIKIARRNINNLRYADDTTLMAESEDLAVQGILKSPLQHHSPKASIIRCSAIFMVQLSYPYMTTGKNIPLAPWNFVGK